MAEQIELITILKELHNISGFRISVHDNEFNEILAYPKELTSFCKHIQQCESGKTACLNCDKAAFDKVKETKTAYIYRCPFGLNEAVSPLFHYGMLSGYLMMGQTLDNDINSKEYVSRAAAAYCDENGKLKSCIDKIPISTEDKIASCITIMKICADYITINNRFKANEKDLASKVKQYLHQHYHENITLDLLSTIFYCSKSTLTTCFKATYKTTIMNCLNKIRVNKAVELLSNPKLSIKNIALSCGFTDQNYFTKVFQKETRFTPRDFRANKCS